jgi:hypothetical protein
MILSEAERRPMGNDTIFHRNAARTPRDWWAHDFLTPRSAKRAIIAVMAFAALGASAGLRRAVANLPDA